MRRSNRLLVLETVKNSGPISRADLSRMTGLTKSTISEIVSFFIKTGVLKEVGTKSSYGVGRRGILVDINSEDFLVIGYDIGTLNSRVILTNLRGEILRKKVFRTLQGEDNLVDQVGRKISEVAKDVWDKIVEIGFGISGMVDHKSGVVIHSPNLDLKEFPLLRILSKRIKKRMTIEHNVKLMMIAEREYGNAKGYSNVLLVNIGPGIGASFVSEGHLIRGSHNFSGEIGHISIVPDGELCRCGKKGCLETVSAAWGIVREYTKKIGETWSDIYGADKVAERAENGDKDALEVFQNAGKYLGKVLAYAANILDPEMILISGGLSNSWNLMESAFKAEFETNTIPPLKGKIKIVMSNLGEFSTALGASTIAIEDFVKSVCS